MLLYNQGLEFLSLQNVGCSVHACKAVDELLPADSQLAGLHLYNNMSGDEGAAHIARLLGRCPMADFRMASSRVGPAGGISLAKALTTGVQVCIVLHSFLQPVACTPVGRHNQSGTAHSC